MSKWKIKLVGKAHVYRFVEIEAADLDAAIDQAENIDNNAQTALDDWIVDETIEAHIAARSWRRV